MTVQFCCCKACDHWKNLKSQNGQSECGMDMNKMTVKLLISISWAQEFSWFPRSGDKKISSESNPEHRDKLGILSWRRRWWYDGPSVRFSFKGFKSQISKEVLQTWWLQPLKTKKTWWWEERGWGQGCGWTLSPKLSDFKIFPNYYI